METKNPSKILVVDDDPRLRDLLRRYLGEQGFNVYVAENAPSMNKLWVRERFDLLVLDLMLPGEDGLSICRRLRGSNDRTPIIMLTAKGEDVDRIVGLEIAWRAVRNRRSVRVRRFRAQSRQSYPDQKRPGDFAHHR